MAGLDNKVDATFKYVLHLVPQSEVNFCELNSATPNMFAFESHRRWQTLVDKNFLCFMRPLHIYLHHFATANVST
jgi:hypothetical protein